MTAPFLGLLMLDTRFPRPPGDIGNPLTFERAGIPVRHAVVAGASPRRVVVDADPALLEPFVRAAVELAADGARMISTSCGFLAAHQAVLARAVPVPVITSSLLQCAALPSCGIVTIDAASMSAAVLAGAGVPTGTPVQGVEPGGEFHRAILGNLPSMDLDRARRDVVAAALRLVERHPQVEHIVLECTNMPPYRDAVGAATGRRVHDLESLLLARWHT